MDPVRDAAVDLDRSCVGEHAIRPVIGHRVLGPIAPTDLGDRQVAFGEPAQHLRLHAVAGLDVAQKQMVQQLLKDLIRPFRSLDAEEIQKCLREESGADELRLTFYQEGQHGHGRAWDIWKLE